MQVQWPSGQEEQATHCSVTACDQPQECPLAPMPLSCGILARCMLWIRHVKHLLCYLLSPVRVLISLDAKYKTHNTITQRQAEAHTLYLSHKTCECVHTCMTAHVHHTYIQYSINRHRSWGLKRLTAKPKQRRYRVSWNTTPVKVLCWEKPVNTHTKPPQNLFIAHHCASTAA